MTAPGRPSTDARFPVCACGRVRLQNFTTGKLWTRCARCRAVKARTPGQQSPSRRLQQKETT